MSLSKNIIGYPNLSPDEAKEAENVFQALIEWSASVQRRQTVIELWVNLGVDGKDPWKAIVKRAAHAKSNPNAVVFEYKLTGNWSEMQQKWTSGAVTAIKANE